MVKAYNEIWVDNLRNLDTIATWRSQQKLTNNEYEQASSLFQTPFYQPNFFHKNRIISIQFGSN
jgi:hypothetical protein